MPPDEPNEITRVLVVEDEAVSALALTRRLAKLGYEIAGVADSSQQALVMALATKPTLVLMDIAIQGTMDGVDTATELLRQMDIPIIFLTAHSDTATIERAKGVSPHGYLLKPFEVRDISIAIEMAVHRHRSETRARLLRQAAMENDEQRRLMAAEHTLLEDTLQGSIKALVEVLSLTNPAAFGRAMRVKGLVSELAHAVGMEERWQVEVAAMLSRVGYVTLPPEVVEKLDQGQPLKVAETGMVERLPAVTDKLLANIPRLEVVRAILASHFRVARPPAKYSAADEAIITRGARLLFLVTDFDALEAKGIAAPAAVSTLRGRAINYDPALLEALVTIRGNLTQEDLRELRLRELRPGMVLAEDLRMVSGVLFVGRGYVVTETFVERCKNFRAGLVREPVRVVVPASPPVTNA